MLTFRRSVGAILVIGFLCGSRGAAQDAPRVSRDWKRIEADGLEVVGDASEKDLRRVLKEISAFRSSVMYHPHVPNTE